MRARTVIGILFLLALAQWLTAPYWHKSWGMDFSIYLNGGEGWLYADWTKIYWSPFRLLDWSTAWFLWFWMNVTATLILVYLITTRIRYGWIITLAFAPVYHWTWGTGNVIPLLAFLCLSPMGCVLAGTCKPYLWLILGLYAIGDCPHPRVQTVLSQVRFVLSADPITHTQEEA